MTSAASEAPTRFALLCATCGRPADGPRATQCAACGGALTVDYSLPAGAAVVDARRRGMWRYAPLLPVEDAAAGLSLGEGATPLVRSRAIARQLGLARLHFKVEGANPTGSYKDRIAAVGLSRMRELGVQAWAATSSGNAGAALAAYGASAGMTGTLFVLQTAPRAKLTQILAYGPRAVSIQGLGRDPEVERNTFRTVRGLCETYGWALQITAYAFNPIGMEGAKTIAFEIAEDLGRMPGAVYVPTGGGGLLSAIHKGFVEWAAFASPGVVPKIVCVQAEGCDPVCQAWREGREVRTIPTCTSKISGIQLTAPPDGALALQSVRTSGGWATSVSDAEVYAAQRLLAQSEGLFCEPASAATVAALLRDVESGAIAPDDEVVCVLTGTGFKDAAAAQAMSEGVDIPIIPLDQLKDALRPADPPT